MPHPAKVLDKHLKKDPKTGIYKARIKTQNGSPALRSTKTKSLEEARKIVDDSHLVEIQAAAAANALTSEALTAIMANRKVTCEAALVEWVQWRSGFVAPNTVRTQESVLRLFFERFNLLRAPVGRINFEHLNAFVNAEDAGKLSNREQRLATLRSFFQFLAARAYYVGNPTMLVRIRYSAMSHEQKEPTERLPFTEREVNHIVTHTTGFWRFATLLSYWAGLRLSDVACLEWGSLLPDEIVVWTRKGDARVALPLDHALIGGGKLRMIFLELMSEHNMHPKLVFPQEAAVITDPRKRSKLSVYFARILERLGIEGKSFHSLRHSFATRMDRSGKSIEEIGRMLGHAPSSSAVTSGYIHRKGKT